MAVGEGGDPGSGGLGGAGGRSTVGQRTRTLCFAAGTRIRTMRGKDVADVPVEGLSVGDVVLTSSGAGRPIRWLGHRTIDCLAHPRPQEVLPIRIATGAFGDRRPERDLFVSPAHAISINILGEALVPAHILVNGSTIRQVDVDAVTYWHVELDSHDILLAENLGAESYIDMGNRAFFEDAGGDDPAGPDCDPSLRTPDAFCRPFHTDGRFVDVVRSQLRVRAEKLGWRLQQQDDLGELHLLVDRERIPAAGNGLSVCFAVPAGARDIRLMSNAAVPNDIGVSADQRCLGSALAAITIVGGFATRAVALDDPRLEDGFNDLEGMEGGHWRWTTGRARLAAALWDDIVGPTLLRIDLAGPGLPRWIAPDQGPPEQRSTELRLVR